MSQCLALRTVLLLLVSACVNAPAKQPNPTRPLDEHRAIPIIARAYKESGETPVDGRSIRLTTGKSLRVDVGTQGRQYGVAFMTEAEQALLDANNDLPPHTPGGDLPVVQGAGADADAVILVLFAGDYQDDEFAGDHHEATAITSARKLVRDVRDFLTQARLRRLP